MCTHTYLSKYLFNQQRKTIFNDSKFKTIQEKSDMTSTTVKLPDEACHADDVIMLSPLDIVCRKLSIPMLWYYHSNLDPSRLIEALEKTIVSIHSTYHIVQ